MVSKNWPVTVRQTIADLDLTYYLPCIVRGRTIAYLGVSRTEGGDFLTSEDLELLVTVSGYVGIAIENARLYRSLARKMAGVRAAQGIQREHRRIDQRGHPGGRPGRPRRKLELAAWSSSRGSRGTRPSATRSQTCCPRISCSSSAAPAARAESGTSTATRCGPSSKARSSRCRPAAANGHAAAAAAANSRQPQPQRETVLNVAVAPLISKDLEQIGRLIIFDDVTERDELERRLVQADKLSSVGLLAAGVAHEVNTPLAVISTYAQMLAKQVSGDDQKSRLLEKIAKQTFRASEIVNSLLNFSRTSPTAFDELDLNRVVQESLTLIEHQMEKAGIKVQLDLEEQIAFDQRQFRQAPAGLPEPLPERAGRHGSAAARSTVRTWRQAETVRRRRRRHRTRHRSPRT